MLDMHGSFYGDGYLGAALEAPAVSLPSGEKAPKVTGLSGSNIAPRISQLRIAALSPRSPRRSVAGG